MSTYNTANTNTASNPSTILNNPNSASFNTTTNNVVLQTLRSRKTTKTSIPLDERVTLDKAFGFTIQSNARASQSCDGTVAYLAGCVIVLYDCNNIYNQEFIMSPAKKTLTCLAFSPDGKTIATGESGFEPKVRVWDVREKTQIAEFSGHKFAIDCVSFSTAPSSNLLVSVGNMHDMVVNVWNCRTKFKVASNKIACKVKGIAFSQDGSYFVTVGNRHVKFWYLTVSSLMETVPLRGRAAILGDMKNNYFCDVVCGRGENSHLTYAITTNGVLCEFNENRYLSRVAELHVERSYCINADDGNLFIGCSNGTILIFRQRILDCISSLSRPHYLGVDVAQGLDTSHVIANLNNPDIKHPDCIAICYDKYDFILSAFYNDHSFYVWDIKDLTQVKKIDSHLFHSASCGSIDTFMSSFLSSSGSEVVLPESQSGFSLPLDSFVTCSSDNTIRVWSMAAARGCPGNNGTKLKGNIYSKELLKVIYMDGDLSALCEVDQSIDISDPATTAAVSQSLTQALAKSSSDTAQTDAVKLGARCIKISPYGRHLASGDRNGNIRIYDLSSLESVCMIEAHIAEVLDLQYSQPESGKQLLASSSRDRLIHIFDASKTTYDLLQIIADHSAAITAIRFCFNQLENQLHIISCGADKSLMIRSTSLENSNPPQQLSTSNGISSHSPNHMASEFSSFVRTSFVAEKQTFHDLNIDPSRNYVNTISQDRMIREYSIKDGKKLRQFRGSLNEDGYLLKMDIDRGGQLMATACSDKIVYIWDLKTTECLAYLYGHSENVNDLKFTLDGQHLITVGADGCLFTWRINNLYSYLSNPIQPSLIPTQHPLRSSHTRQSVPNFTIPPLLAPNEKTLDQQTAYTTSMDSIFDIDDDEASLPAWARKKLEINNSTTTTQNSWSTTTTTTTTTTEVIQNNQHPSKSGRAVWGDCLNASLIAVDSELSSLASTITISHTEATPENNVDNQTIAAADNLFELTPKTSLKNFENCIQFPSPCIDKDSYQVKQFTSQQKQESMSLKPGSRQQRPSWICSNNEEDLIFNLHRLSTEEDLSSSDELDTPCSSDSGDSPVIIEDVSCGQVSKTDDLLVSPCTPTSKLLTGNKNCFSIADNVIKLECDMENSLRRQSISARYLLRTAQQKESQQSEEKKKLVPVNLIEALKETEMIAQEVKKEAKKDVKDIGAVVMPLAADFRMKSSKPTRCSIGNSSNFQLLYSHHTESSLNKAKPKQPQQFHSSNNLLKETVSSSVDNQSSTKPPESVSMKRCPSVSSIPSVTNHESSASSINSSSATSSSSSIKQLNTKSKLASPSKQSSIQSRVNHFEQQTEKQQQQRSQTASSNLKKASSMISLNQQQNQQTKPSATRVKTTKDSTTTTTTTTTTSHQFLPPKTVRQVKQRSAERQYTTPDLRTISTSTTTANIKSTNLNTVNTFSEQNKHLRKLSNSIQNLHHNNNTNKTPLHSAVTTQLITEQCKDTELDLISKLNKINSDQTYQMSLSSSSVECLELGQTNQMLETNNNNDNDNDLDIMININQPNSSSHTTNSLTSSSSSSCSLFDNQNDLKEDMVNKTEHQDEDKLKNSGNSERRTESGGFCLSGFSSNGLKKPVTFASIKAANSQQQLGCNKQIKSKSATNSPYVINSTINTGNITNSYTNTFSNSKIDSIRSEFIQNIKNLQFILSQGSKNLDEYAKFQQQSSHQVKSLLSEQTHQQIQMQLHSFVKQMNSVHNTNKQLTTELELA